jgi:hypothetical protein
MKTTNNSRRSFIKWSGLLSAGIITGLQANALGFETNPSQHKLENLQQDDGAFQLPALPYTYDALALKRWKFIIRNTMPHM